MAPIRVRYEAAGWGAGELWLDGESLLWHELPHGTASGDAADHPLAERLVRYFRGEAVAFDDVKLAPDDEPEFVRALRATLRRVPRGAVVTYGELAALAGRPRAARAAGTFCARNRFPIVVPCHRVVAAGSVGGYGSLGVEYKRRLLGHERPELSSH